MSHDPTKSEKPGELPRASSSNSGTEVAVEHADNVRHRPGGNSAAPAGMDPEARKRFEASQKLANPLAGIGRDELARMGEAYAHKARLTSEEDMRAFRLGAMIAGDENSYDTIPELTEREREVLGREETHKWSNPSMLYWVIVSEY